MRTVKLGKTEIETSVVALGTWAFGGWMWGGADKKGAVEAIDAALDAGINFIDTAPIYGFGLSEEIIGEALQGRRDKFVLATKCGMVTSSQTGTFKFNATTAGYSETGHIGVFIDLSPTSIKEEVEASLKRLKTDYIDLYQTHWQDDDTPGDEVMTALLDLKKEGKIRAIGVSNASCEEMKEYLSEGDLDSDQERFSMLDRKIESEQLPFCQEREISVLAYSPLANGLLTGKFGPDSQFKEGDLRKDNPRFVKENLAKVSNLIEALKPILDDHDITPGQLAIAWTLHQPGLTHALCGARNPKQAHENAVAGDVALSDEELSLIENEFNKLGIK